MITRAESRALPSPRQVGAWLAAPLRAREAPDPPRTRLGRLAPWIAGIATPFTLVLLYEASRVEGFALLGAVEVSVGAATAVVALLGWHPLNAWRLAALTTAGWLLLGPRPEHDVFALPSAQVTVLMLAAVMVHARHRRDLGWGVWAWTVTLLLLGPNDPAPVVTILVILTLVTLVIDARRQRTRARAEAAREREARVMREAQSLVLEERARIARDLHDVVAHHMSMVAVQAETAQYRLGGVDEPVREEFSSIARSARAALSDVRGILTVLRDAEAEVERAPQPGIDGLEALVGTARGAGAEVELTVMGDRRPLPAALEIGVYRIVQESLANAARHAPGAAIAVVVAYRERQLEVTITNGLATGEVPAPADDGVAARGGGHGLVGMRERAHLLGGEVTAAPTPGGGFRVAATLPTEVATA